MIRLFDSGHDLMDRADTEKGINLGKLFKDLIAEAFGKTAQKTALSRVKRAILFDKSPWGRFGEEALKFGENGFCYLINKFDYF